MLILMALLIVSFVLASLVASTRGRDDSPVHPSLRHLSNDPEVYRR